MKQIAFFGATGMIGKPVIHALVQSGFQITALVRDTTKAKKTVPVQVRLIEGDLNDINVIEKVLEAVDVVYLNLSVTPNSRKTEFQSVGRAYKAY